jgi:hypothetical protein
MGFFSTDEIVTFLLHNTLLCAKHTRRHEEAVGIGFINGHSPI